MVGRASLSFISIAATSTAISSEICGARVLSGGGSEYMCSDISSPVPAA
jgi:hypothetical protein